MIRRIIQIPLAAILTLSALWLGSAAALSQEVRLKVTPQIVRVGAFYGGASVRVEGVTPRDEKLVIVVRGEEMTEIFNKVGRVGPIWINTGKVTISGVPSLLLIFSSEPVNACLTRPAIDKYGLDLPALNQHLRIESKTRDYQRIADDYFHYKASQGTYRLANDGIRINQSDRDRMRYSLDLTLPKAAGPGQYEISLLECRGGEVVRNSYLPLKVVEVGFPALIAWLASERPSTYGILSVVVAMLAGFGIDFLAARLFRKRMARR